ncbi:hypothetical protein LXN10_09895 [Arcobacter sp. KX21116]|jgi:benzoyl-CoA reductase/2-hydroxyglutaryl-CoA dehydratase subunit BcrC/BadD/HgdB|uniref:hypothetical protein n=1 Tax=Arcobacter iocasae TaxID=2906515 RepID=UPI0035D3F844|tara:strand:+ start:7838 stop:8089 length:252 start_codon:yes stop_codon:yes gene_type:complete
MSDMSFKQAKELVEKLELTELTLKKSTDDIDKSSKKFNEALKMQEHLLKLMQEKDKKLDILKLLVVLNVGFIGGLLAGVFLFK